MGARLPQTRLTEPDVVEIRRLQEEGWRQQRLATKFGVSQMTISKLVRRETWKHVA